jgi:site-specific recombinase XerD
LSPATLITNRASLDRFLRFCEERHLTALRAVTARVLDAFATYLKTRYRGRGTARGRRLAPTSRQDTLRQVRGLFAFLVREGHLLLDPAQHLVARLPRRLDLEREVRQADLEAMLATCAPTGAMGPRNRAMLEVLYGCGLRRSELVGLDLYDVDLKAGTILVRHGKGGKTRLLPVAGQARRAVRHYIHHARPLVISKTTGNALFLGEWGRRLSGGRLSQILHECAHRAGLARRATPHGLRHGFALALLRHGAGVESVRRLLGHARVDTTELYTALTAEDLRQVHRRTHPRERRSS